MARPSQSKAASTKRWQAWKPMFLEFIGKLQIDSKEMTQPGPLTPYLAQTMFIDQVCQGLDDGIRFFVNLKARQLGISTISLAIDLFWLFVHPGMQGALVTDTEDNKEIFRHTLERYIKGLPASYKVPIQKHNRGGLFFTNGSVLQYLVAGTRGKTTLGTSRALNFLHATEVAKWGQNVGLDSLMSTLAEQNPNRLYIFESTANGKNNFFDMWNRAKEDPAQKAFFIGWWAKDIYRIPKADKRYPKVMEDPPSDEERAKATIVQQAYQFTVDDEQLAWYRDRQRNREYSEGAMEQEFPWHEEEAFIMTGNHFFPSQMLSRDLRKVFGPNPIKFKGYRYILGETFTQTALDVMQMDPVHYSGQAELRIFEDPVNHGKYAMGVDPAYGRTDHGDSHAISIWRCYADRLVQVAEYATPNQETYQLIWVIAHLASVYRDIMINLEINGPGTAVLQGIKHLKAQLMAEAMRKGEPGLPNPSQAFVDCLQGARWYLYHRPDSFGAGYLSGWKTQADNKIAVMNQMRDTYMQQNLIPRSGPLLRQMETITQDGGEIAAEGRNKDDRVFAAAFAHRAWIDWIRGPMMMNGQTFENVTKQEEREKTLGGREDNMLVAGIVKQQFERAAANRRQAAIDSRFNRRFDRRF